MLRTNRHPRASDTAVGLVTFSDPASAARVRGLHKNDSWLLFQGQRLRVELAHRDPAAPDRIEGLPAPQEHARRTTTEDRTSSGSDSPSGLSTLDRRVRRARESDHLQSGVFLPSIGSYHSGPGGFAGSDLSFAPSAVCRTASLNIEGASPTRDHTSVGGIVGLYCLRWRVTYAFLTEAPLR